jgi:ABC-type Fe3+ transport system substrate-binding protein
MAETLLIPNTVAVIRNAPHPASAQKLFEYLQRRELAEKLVQVNALEGADLGRRRGNESQTGQRSETPHVVAHGEVESLALKPDWDSLLRDLDATTTQLNEIFLR